MSSRRTAVQLTKVRNQDDSWAMHSKTHYYLGVCNPCPDPGAKDITATWECGSGYGKSSTSNRAAAFGTGELRSTITGHPSSRMIPEQPTPPFRPYPTAMTDAFRLLVIESRESSLLASVASSSLLPTNHSHKQGAYTNNVNETFCMLVANVDHRSLS